MGYKSFRYWLEQKESDSAYQYSDEDVRRAVINTIPGKLRTNMGVSSGGGKDDEALLSKPIRAPGRREGLGVVSSILNLAEVKDRLDADAIERIRQQMKSKEGESMTFGDVLDTILGQNAPGNTVPFDNNVSPTMSEPSNSKAAPSPQQPPPMPPQQPGPMPQAQAQVVPNQPQP